MGPGNDILTTCESSFSFSTVHQQAGWLRLSSEEPWREAPELSIFKYPVLFGPDYAKALIWGFISGFSGRFVPDAIGLISKESA